MKDKRKGLWKVLFGRTTIFVLLILIQLGALILGVVVLDYYVIIANYIIGGLSVIILVYIVNIKQNSSFKIMWIILILATPIVGVPFYIFTRFKLGTNYIESRIEEQQLEQRELLLPEKDTVDKLLSNADEDYGLFKYLYELGHFPVYDNSGIKYFPLGENKYEELLKQLKCAKHFIFVEYFIICKGEVWSTVLDILKEKAREGVEVRLLYDGTNMLMNLPKNYPKELKKYGIECRVFSPMKPFLSTHQNNRDHRKIVVIDGHTAFTGGINLADEYMNKINRFGHWKDTAIMVRGKAVNSFTMMFLQMWNINSKHREKYEKYAYKGVSKDESLAYGGYIAPYGDSPLDNEYVGKKVYLDILNRARTYVHIMTPYLILDEELTNALTFASEKGIDVKLILPHIPDKKYAYYLARTHYPELISSGVKIFEYTPGFVHAKVFTSDDRKAVVGTINLDFRSLLLHFECASYIWENPIVSEIEGDFQNTLKKCQQISLRDCKEYSIVGKVCGKVLRLIAPLM